MPRVPMNTEIQAEPAVPSSTLDLAPRQSQADEVQPSTKSESQPFTQLRRRIGKIAGLPALVRINLNQMLEDGLPYAAIIKKLGIHGKDLTENNLSDWFKSGYQEWLKRRDWIEAMHERHESLTDFIRENQSGKIHEAIHSLLA